MVRSSREKWWRGSGKRGYWLVMNTLSAQGSSARLLTAWYDQEHKTVFSLWWDALVSEFQDSNIQKQKEKELLMSETFWLDSLNNSVTLLKVEQNSFPFTWENSTDWIALLQSILDLDTHSRYNHDTQPISAMKGKWKKCYKQDVPPRLSMNFTNPIIHCVWKKTVSVIWRWPTGMVCCAPCSTSEPIP